MYCKECGAVMTGKKCAECAERKLDKELVPGGKRKRQPKDPTVYEPDFNGIGAWNE